MNKRDEILNSICEPWDTVQIQRDLDDEELNFGLSKIKEAIDEIKDTSHSSAEVIVGSLSQNVFDELAGLMCDKGYEFTKERVPDGIERFGKKTEYTISIRR